MAKKLIRVSDHAVLRYLERVQGVDVEAARGKIQAEIPKNALQGVYLGGELIIKTKGFRIIIRNRAVISVII